MGGWVLAAAVVSSYAASQSDAAQGKTKGGEPMYTARNMPDELLNRYQDAQNQMPVGVNVGFGDQQFPGFYGPNARMSQMLYAPAGSTSPPPYADPYGAAVQAALPFVNAWANQPQQQQQQAPQGRSSTHQFGSY